MSNVIPIFRKTLMVDHKAGTVTSPTKVVEDFDARVLRIRHSLEKINNLMDELRKKNKENNDG